MYRLCVKVDSSYTYVVVGVLFTFQDLTEDTLMLSVISFAPFKTFGLELLRVKRKPNLYALILNGLSNGMYEMNYILLYIYKV